MTSSSTIARPPAGFFVYSPRAFPSKNNPHQYASSVAVIPCCARLFPNWPLINSIFHNKI